MVASTGGHLTELWGLRHRLVAPGDDVTWVTFESPQAASVLAGERVVYVPEVAPRGYRALLSSVRPARRILEQTGAERVISTGAGVALSFLPQARVRGLSCHYIESAARTQGPSATGRILQALRAAHLYTQQPAWARPPWSYGGSIFDGMDVAPRVRSGPVRRVLVSLGTSPFSFSRLVRRLELVLPSEVEVVWQTGATAPEPLGGRVVRAMSHEQLVKQMAAADVVVAHAGVGSALTAMSVGHCPVLVPRRSRHDEHVDDHQQQIAQALAGRGLAVTVEADQLELTDLHRAAAAATVARQAAPRFHLQDSPPHTPHQVPR